MEREKVDKGYEFNYSKLTYRRKFIRNLWSIPIFLFAIIFGWRYGSNFIINMINTILLPIIFIVQLTYTYLKWQKEIL